MSFSSDFRDIIVCATVASDVLCGTLQCDISAVSDQQPARYFQSWTRHGTYPVSVSGVTYQCTSAEYLTFYNGPAITDPGLVPDGAACGTGKVHTYIHTYMHAYSRSKKVDRRNLIRQHVKCKVDGTINNI